MPHTNPYFSPPFYLRSRHVVIKKNIIPVLFKNDWKNEKIVAEICRLSEDSFKEGNTVYVATNGGNRMHMMAQTIAPQSR